MNRVYTGNYKNCKFGNLISISGDRGKSVNFNGKAIPELAPKLSFWKTWYDNIGIISEEENIRFYIEEYYKQVLSKVNIEELLGDEINPILLCYEESSEFCHRHVLAEYIGIKYGIRVQEVEVSYSGKYEFKKRPYYIRKILFDVIDKYETKEHIKKLHNT